MIDFRQIMTRARSSGGNPRKILGVVIAVSVVLLMLWLLLIARMDYSTTPVRDTDSVAQDRRDSIRVMMGKTETVYEAEDRSSRIFLNAFTTFVILVIVMGGVWYWSRRNAVSGYENQIFKEYGQQSVGPGQQIKVLEINNEIWVLGVSTDSITLLHRYPKDQWKGIEQPAKKSDRRFYDLFTGKS